jgi:hypothetical protein
MAMADKPLFTFATSDNNAKVGAVSFPIEEAADYGTVENALTAALEGIVNGLTKEHGVYDRTWDNARLLGPKASDKSHSWRITVRDTINGRLDSYKVPTANYLLRADDSDGINITLPAYATLVTAIEANVVSSEGNPVVLVSVIYES